MYCDEFNQLTEQIENMSFDEQFTSAEGLWFDFQENKKKFFFLLNRRFKWLVKWSNETIR
jgi:hypothetical protein